MPTKVLIISLLFVNSLFSQSNLNESKIDKILNNIKESTQTVGFSVAIVKGDKIIYSKGFGYKDLESKAKVDENTLFPIGSTSKAFTTALLGIMEDENGLQFSDSPQKYIPELEFYNDELNNNVTIEDMVCHRTGLPRHDFSWYLFPTENKDSLIARVKYHEPFTEVRKKWYYNNFMYLAQGLITEKLTGKTWEDNIRERFFIPLQMTSSNLTIEELEKSENISRGYSLENFTTNTLTPYYSIDAISPAGSINSSANEMANWLKVWLNDGKYNDIQVLPASYVKKAINPLMIVGKGIADEEFPDQHLNSYGYAWFNSSYKGHYRLEHGGNIDGFTANVSFFPTDDIGIVVLSNQDGSMLPTLVRNAISDEILDLERTDWVSKYDEKIAAYKLIKEKKEELDTEDEQSNSEPTHQLSEYTGNYTHKGYGTVKLVVNNDSLWAKFTREKAYLEHTHFDVFTPYMVKSNNQISEDGIGFKFNFKTNDLGDIEGVYLKLEPTLEPLFFKRSPAELLVSKTDLEKFVGSYVLSGAELKLSIKNEKLMLFVPGQPEYTLNPIKANEFVIGGLTDYKVEINGNKLILHQPNGTFTAIKK